MSISLCLIVKDEEKELDEFLKNISELVDEIIIVDTGSKDQTKEIAKKYTEHLYELEWKDDFSHARNFSISKATKEWILWLDPDEHIDKSQFKKIRELIKDKESDGYKFIQKTYTNCKEHTRFAEEKKKEYDGFYVRNICKLFRNSKNFRFRYPIHETIRESILKNGGKIKKEEIWIEHYPEKKNRERIIKKEKLYLNILKKKKKDFPESNAEKEIETEKKILCFFKDLS